MLKIVIGIPQTLFLLIIGSRSTKVQGFQYLDVAICFVDIGGMADHTA
jgi:hypothetical protein